MNRRNDVQLLFSLLVVAMMLGCVHERAGDVDPTLVEVRATVTLDEGYATATLADGARATEGAWERRLVVEAYRRGERERVARVVVPVTGATVEGGKVRIPLSFRVPALDYSLVAWCDYTPSGSVDDALYNTADLRAVACTDPYAGGSPWRECARGTAELDLSGYREDWGASAPLELALQRPVGRWRLVATDLARFRRKTAADRESGRVYRARYSYAFYLPTGVDAMTGAPAASRTGVTFELPLVLPPEGTDEMEIGSDHVFATDAGAFVSLTVEVVDDTGKTVARLRGLEVPYRRGVLTTVRGDFLTTEMEGGVHIETEYEGEEDVDLDDLIKAGARAEAYSVIL